jgi:hypothetical protein
LDFFLLLVFQSWHLASRYVRAAAEGQREARQALALSSLKLSEAMTKKTTSFVAPHFQAWVTWIILDYVGLSMFFYLYIYILSI